jgi:predicted metal-binding protein
MSRARVAQYALTKRLRDALRDRLESPLHLGAGGCGECAVCSKVYNAPCVAPDRAIASLEAYTIDVSALAKESGLAYHSGANTVTYFGVVFFKWESVRE